jgi:hypothetical protein
MRTSGYVRGRRSKAPPERVVSDATYGDLVAAAERHLVRAIFDTREPFRSTHAARDAVTGYADLLVALKDGVRAVAGVVTAGEPVVAPSPTSPAGTLSRVLDVAVAGFNRSRESTLRGGEWNASARAMVAATTLLASHLGPDRSHRTPDAARLDDAPIQGAELHRLGAFALTMAAGGRHLALRVQDSVIRFPNPGQLRAASQWLMTTQTALGESAAAVIIDHRTPSRLAGLSTLRPAPLLTPTREGDPIAASHTSFDRVRLFAHRQASGELAVGIDAVRAYATVGLLVAVHGHAIAAAAGSIQRDQSIGREGDLAEVARGLLQVRDPWAQLINAAENCNGISKSPPLLGREVALLSSTLRTLTRDSNRWRSPAEIVPTRQVEERLLHLVHHLASRLPDLSSATKAIVERLHERGELLVPTREREDIDLPYRWAPVSPERRGALRNAARDAQTTSMQAAAATGVILHAGTLRQPPPIRPSLVPTRAASTRCSQ